MGHEVLSLAVLSGSNSQSFESFQIVFREFRIASRKSERFEPSSKSHVSYIKFVNRVSLGSDIVLFLQSSYPILL